MSKKSIRPEARPQTKLGESQNKALRRILDALRETLDEIGSQEYREDSEQDSRGKSSTRMDRFRAARIVFLAGERGSGKTSVLLTAIDLLKDAKQGIITKFQDDKDLQANLQRVGPHVIWLDTLDLEPLPGPTNLLAAVMVRILKAAEEMLPENANRSEPTSLQMFLQSPDAVLPLRELTRDIATAWDGNLESRGRVPPDVFAVESERAEKARLGLAWRFRVALDRLAKGIQNAGANQTVPIFVLPVDDFDLNPAIAIDLLRLLRMISAPRLFCIVLGDLELAETVVNLKVAGDLTALIPYARNPQYAAIPPDVLGGVVRQVSANAIRKLLPPYQRVALERHNVDSALDYRPDPSRPLDSNAKNLSIAELLENFPLELEPILSQDPQDSTDPQDKPTYYIAGRRINNLRDFLALQSIDPQPLDSARGKKPTTGRIQFQNSGETEKRATTGSAVYSGSNLFFAPFRHLTDFWFDLNEAAFPDSSSPPNPLDLIVILLAREARRAIHEDSKLLQHGREQLLGMISDDPDRGIEFLTDGRAARSRMTAGSEITVDSVLSLQAGHFRHWMAFTTGDGPGGQPGLFPEPRTQALLITLHDLLTLRSDVGLIGGSHAPDPYALPWAEAVWNLGPERIARFSWPTPSWNSFWEFDLLRSAWKNARSALARTADSKKVELLAFTWIASITSILSSRAQTQRAVDKIPKKEKPQKPGDNSSESKGEPPDYDFFRVCHLATDVFSKEKPEVVDSDWEQVLDAIVDLALEAAPVSGTSTNSFNFRKTTEARKDRIETWLVALACLLAPESGLASDGEALPFIQRFCNRLEPFWKQEQIALAIRYRRTRRLDEFIKQGAPFYFRALGVVWSRSKMVGPLLSRLAGEDSRHRFSFDQTSSAIEDVHFTSYIDTTDMIMGIDSNWSLKPIPPPTAESPDPKTNKRRRPRPLLPLSRILEIVRLASENQVAGEPFLTYFRDELWGTLELDSGFDELLSMLKRSKNFESLASISSQAWKMVELQDTLAHNTVRSVAISIAKQPSGDRRLNLALAAARHPINCIEKGLLCPSANESYVLERLVADSK